MAKLRRNHSGGGTAMSSSSMIRVVLFTMILLGIIWLFQKYGLGHSSGEAPEEYVARSHYEPVNTKGQRIDHGGFILSYNEEWEQAEWVAYILERENLKKEWLPRPKNFYQDPNVSSGSALDSDYRGSGYDRGHMAPYADFAWSDDWGKGTFVMSNISPQARQFNQGIWRELEELTRDWAKRFKRLYIVTGPVMTQAPKGTIGRQNRVQVPAAYFKVLLDIDEPERKGIGFVIPNRISFEPLYDYAVSIDEVEKITGIDFFSELLPEDEEAHLESSGNPDLWPFSKKKFDRRINKWNNVKN